MAYQYLQVVFQSKTIENTYEYEVESYISLQNHSVTFY